MINQKRLVNTFLKLIKIDSISKKEKAVAEHIRKRLKKLGIRSFYDDAGYYIDGDCGNLYGVLKATKKGLPSVLLNAHIDTVVTKGRINPVIRNGIISADGKTILGADCKAGVAAILEVVSILKKKDIPHGEIKVCFTVAEETGLLGAKQAVKKHLDSDFGLVLDGGSVEKIINRAPSQLGFEASVTGKAAHAGVHPEHGISAIKVASEAISKMKLGRIDKETTANIGIIQGGVATNIVPEEVTMKGEARSHSRKKLKRQINNMTKALAKTCRKYKAFLRVKVDPTYQSFVIKENSPVMWAVKTAAKNAGIKPKIGPTGGGSDANIFNQMGIPSVILGVGMHNVHTSKEYIAIKDLVKGAELILSVVKGSG